MQNDNQFSPAKGLEIIDEMLQKTQANHHENGNIPILWGITIGAISFGNYFLMQFQKNIGVNLWWLVIVAFFIQFIFIRNEKKKLYKKSYLDMACEYVWNVFFIALLCLIGYQNIVPATTLELLNRQGTKLFIFTDSHPEPELLRAYFVPSLMSLYLMLYTIPTLVTALLYKFKPMLIGVSLTYGLFLFSCFSDGKTDMLLSGIAAIICWLIPGLILRTKYTKTLQKNV